MEFKDPINVDFTIYSKSGCENCKKVKNLLNDKDLKYIIIDCDEYIIEDKQNFLLFIQNIAKKDCTTFPMVFNNGKYIGGYNETKKYCDKLDISFEENIDF
jgi:glutaredoxin